MTSVAYSVTPLLSGEFLSPMEENTNGFTKLSDMGDRITICLLKFEFGTAGLSTTLRPKYRVSILHGDNEILCSCVTTPVIFHPLKGK